MTWDSSGYGAHTEKAHEGPAPDWFFAEGAQSDFFHTYLLLVNPHAAANVAHVTYLLEDGATVMREYPLPPTSRVTIDTASETALANRSFGATVSFDRPGMAERAMYFNGDQLFAGGGASAGATAPSREWSLAEAATGSYFETVVLMTNPGAQAASVTVTYLLDNGLTVVKQHPLAVHQRLTLNTALEDPLLASAAFATTVTSDQPVVVERSQYWPASFWQEVHTSTGMMDAGTRWALADGEVGGPTHAQTFLLIANANAEAADLIVTFLRSDGTTLVKTFTVPPTSRFNIAVRGPDGSVPELQDEPFGTVIESTRPILVERSMYRDANGVPWAVGTNAAATRLP